VVCMYVFNVYPLIYFLFKFDVGSMTVLAFPRDLINFTVPCIELAFPLTL
jgi:hypothetical protein